MLFNSFAFLFAFLPLTLAGHVLASRHGARAAAAWLAAASLFFYGWWDWRYLPLLLASILGNYVAALGIAFADDARRGRLLAPAVAANLLLLAYHKYAFFLAASVDAVAASGLSARFSHIVLPIGISFFTFTQIAFLVDTRRGQMSEALRKDGFLNYLLFVTWFPHLIAGPVLHHAEMVPQFAARPRVRAQDLAVGFSLLIIGLAKKVLIADGLAPQASAVFDSPAAASLLPAWGGVLAYAFQLYFDFSGYSDMAVGLSRMFGIRLPFNFDSPYQAENIADFWRRWHMTLSRFLRDYLYIPLGGKRRAPLRRRLNLMLTMLLGGLWHGAGWNFILWGGLHGVYLIVHQGWRALGWRLAAPRCCAIALTFICVCCAWVFFRAPDLHSALRLLRGMAGGYGVALPEMVGARLGVLRAPLEHLGVDFYLGGGSRFTATWSWICVSALIAFCLPNSQQIMGLQAGGRQGPMRLKTALRWSPSLAWAWSLGVLALAGLLSLSHPSEFLYFQF